MVKQEWKNIFHNTWIKVVMIAIIAIPSIYACVFLGSMWDPYGNASEIPVAIVNEDQEVTYNDKSLAVGEELVKNLKNNDSMQFHFVNANEAQKGLEDGNYYMIITIPNNFSKNATTLLDKEPQKMILNYTTNPGTNYIASKMDDSAIAKIKEEVSSSVTKTYAETIFKQIGTLSDGLSEASDGTNQLSDGVHQLVNGNQTISDNLKVLASSSLTFRDGATTLTNGLKDYTNGVVTVNNGVYTLKDGLDTLNSSTDQLSQGVTQLNQGAQSLQNGVTQYTIGVSQVYAGSTELKTGLETVSKELQASLSQENRQLLKTARDGNDLSINLTTLLTQLLSNNQTKDIAIKWTTTKLDATEAQLFPEQLRAYVMNYSYQELVKNIADGNKVAISTLQSGVQELNTAVNGGKLADGSETVGLLAGANQIENGLSQLNQKNSTLVSGTRELAAGTNSLIKQTPILIKGVQALDQGANELYKGTSQLVSNNQTLLGGSSQLGDGASQISSGAKQLATGSSTLGTGLNEVKTGVQTLDSRLKDGAKESQLSTTDSTLDMLSTPVDTSHKEISTVENNGHAMAPYMMSVALYVAGLAFTLMYPMRHGIKEAKSGWKYWVSKATVMYTVSTLAAIVMITCLRFVNGFEPQQLLMTYLFAILVSAAFMSIIVLLNMTTGYIGEFLLLVFMIINLGGSAGTYPLETSTGFFKAIHNLVPYTYSVNGFRKVISMANASLTTEVWVFVGIFAVCTALTICYYQFKNKEDKHLIPEVFEKVNEEN